MPRPERVIGWDVGGAHVKAALVEHGELRDAAQWPCPLWQGLEHLQQCIGAAARRWPEGMTSAQTVHAVTMTGEMVDRFAHREAGVVEIAGLLERMLVGPAIFYAGEPGWCSAGDAPARWDAIASANWLASAQLVAYLLRRRGGDSGVLVDIGSTTSDLIPLCGGRPQARGRNDAERLITGELVYQGVVRTPLCAVAPRIDFQGVRRNVMNELFATTADVYRLTGELDSVHDQQPSADGAAKDLASTRRRIARMIGLDARDASDADWRDFALAWRAAQLDALEQHLHRVAEAPVVAPDAPLVAAGCGDFLVAALAERTARPLSSFATLVLGQTGDRVSVLEQTLRRNVQIAAPACAVALLCSADVG